MGEDLGAPGPEHPAKRGDLGDRAGVHCGQDLPRQDPALAKARRPAVDRPKPLVAVPGELDFPVGVADGQPGPEPAVLPLAEVPEPECATLAVQALGRVAPIAARRTTCPSS